MPSGPPRNSALRAAALASLLLVTAGCATSGDRPESTTPAATPSGESSASLTPSPSPSPSTQQPPSSQPAPQPRVADPRPVPPRQWRAMVAAGMVRPECPVQERSQLRRIDVVHRDLAGDVRRGHVVVHADTAASLRRILARMLELDFPIARMRGVEAYDGDTEASLRDNNTSAYNCRRPDQINAPFAESPHANGRAVDINPVQNPWVDLRCDCWVPGVENSERTPGPGKILEGGPVWRAFTDEGWIWQNIDTPDYMHFDTGYPSAPYQGP